MTGRRTATLIPGDGIGPEVVGSARRAVEATGVDIRWEVREIGLAALAREGTALPPEALASIRETGVALKGPVATPVESGLRSVNVALRQALDLYACVRPCRLYPGVPSVYDEVDLVVIRENTEGMYTGIEFEMGTTETKELIRFIGEATGKWIREDSGVSIKTISEQGSARIARFAFEHAIRHGRKKVTASHKANIMKFSDGLFLEVARRVASEEFPQVPFEDRIIDALCMMLIQRPEAFDVLVMPNLYGDVVSELGAGLIGGIGVAPGGHFGDGAAVFEATHGTAPKHAGADRANPMGAMLSAAMMLRHMGETEAGDRLEAAVAATVAAGEVTADLALSGHPALGTRAFTDAVCYRLGKGR
ncbi:MAG: isocitrate/isopropylmalate dehydrogenase family protein [Actinobacteria bacterium]|nr:isocitrate/isopropylmalate dehydrogenase family protein [Actinomycetota bacterium]